jgi:hypothetical protein
MTMIARATPAKNGDAITAPNSAMTNDIGH